MSSTRLRDHRFHLLRVERVVHETTDAVTLVFDIPDDLTGTFAYEAGQFCNLRVPAGNEPLMRCYSMSSSPAIDTDLQLTIKRVPGGIVSNWIADNIVPGQSIEVAPPIGFFQLTDTTADLVGYAAGSGITPVISLIKTALATTQRNVFLHYSNRDPDNIIFDDQLQRLEHTYPDRLTVEHRYDNEHGYITTDAVASFANKASNAEFYVCGPGVYMDIIETGLLAKGTEPQQLHIERFTPTNQQTPTTTTPTNQQTPTTITETGPSAADTNLPDDTAAGIEVTITLDGRTDTTGYHAGTTILQTARSMGMAPPFSCESGSCATCMAKLVQGKATMFTNNALTPDEVDDGWILTCQSIPTTTVTVVYGYEEN